jgi:AraC family ethanolamine operon transcriptional activator
MQTHTFEDFDAFSASVRDANFGMLLQNLNSRIWSIDHVDMGGIHVQLGRLGSGNITEGQAESDRLLLYAPLDDDCEHAINGEVITKNAFALLAPGRDFCLNIKPEHAFFSIAVPLDMFAHDDDPAESLFSLENMTSGVTRENRELASRLRQTVRHVMTAAASCPQFESEAAAKSAAADLLKISGLVVGQRPTGQARHEGRPKVSRREIIDRSMALLETRDGEPVLVGELATAAEVSERTLRRAFNEYYGTGPVRYLQLRQLNQVRRTLHAANPDEVTVTDVLAGHGEWEFSRFAKRYRRLFGEHPSQTLQSGIGR